MTDQTPTDPDGRLARALDAATQDLPLRDRVTPALAGAARVRRRRRAVGGALAVAAVVAAVAVPSLVGGGPDRVDPAPSPTRTDEPEPVPAPGEEGDGMLGEYPVWDPASLADLAVDPGPLPALLDPPTDASSLFDDPVDAAVVLWAAKGRDLAVLATDGEWRTLPGTADMSGAWPDGTPYGVVGRLSDDGTRLAVSTEPGVEVVDLRDGSRDTIAWPDGAGPPWDLPPNLLWTDGGDALVVDAWARDWKLTLDGTATTPRWSKHSRGEYFTEPDGTLWQYDWKQRQAWRWNDAGIDHKVVDPVTWGNGWRVAYGRLAVNGNVPVADTDQNKAPYAGPVLLDSVDGEVLAWAPVKDRNSVYSDNGRLQVAGFLDDHTLALVVRVESFADKTDDAVTYLVTWDAESGEFRVVGRTADQGVEADGLFSGTVAPGALADALGAAG